jgi:hypothetical protein
MPIEELSFERTKLFPCFEDCMKCGKIFPRGQIIQFLFDDNAHGIKVKRIRYYCPSCYSKFEKKAFRNKESIMRRFITRILRIFGVKR